MAFQKISKMFGQIKRISDLLVFLDRLSLRNLKKKDGHE